MKMYIKLLESKTQQLMHTRLVGDDASQLVMRSPKLTKQNII